jgi:hypothetical protein
MMRLINYCAPVIALAALVLILPGCASTFSVNANQDRNAFNGTLFGGIYFHTVQPLTFNLVPTDFEESGKEGRGRINQIQYPLSSAISVRLGKNGLGEIAKAHGIEKIYYADIERWSAIFGLWSAEVVHIYGR